MQINQLRAVNFKGSSFNHTLAGVTLFVGSNFAGKSSRVEALLLALLGYLPGVPKTPNEIFDILASGQRMEVAVGTSQGEYVRCWTQNDKGSVRYTGYTGEPPVPPRALDANTFLGISGPERIKLLFKLAALPADMQLDKLKLQLAANFKGFVAEGGHTEQHEAALAQVCGLVDGTVDFEYAAYARDENFALDRASVQEWVIELAEELAGRRKAMAQSVQRMQKTAQGVTQLESQQEEVVVPQDAEAQLAAARTALEQAQAKATSLETQLNTCRTQYREANLKVTQAQQYDAAALAVLQKEQTRLQEEVKAIQAEPDPTAKPKGLKPGVPWASSEWQARVDEAQAAHNAATVAVNTAQARVQELEANLAAIKQAKCCPQCGQSMAKLKTKLTAAAKQQAEQAQADLTTKQDAQDKAGQQLGHAQEQYNKALEREDLKDTRAKTVAEKNGRLAQIAATLAVCSGAVAAKAQCDQLREQGTKLAQELQLAATAVNDCRCSVATWEGHVRNLQAQRAAQAAQAKAAAQALQDAATLAVLKHCEAVVAELRTKLVSLSLDPLLATANKLFAQVLRGPLTLKDGELCMLTPNHGPVRHRSFSGTEKALAYCALCVGLAAQAPCRLAIIDELGRLDVDNKHKVLTQLCLLQRSGELHQVVVVDVAKPPGSNYGDNFEVVQVG